MFASAAATYLEEGDSHARSGGENAASGLRQECEMKEVWGSEKREHAAWLERMDVNKEAVTRHESRVSLLPPRALA